MQRIRFVAQSFQMAAMNRQIDVCEGMLHKDPLIDLDSLLGAF